MRTSNPVFRQLERSEAYVGSEAASYRGIIFKTAILLISAVISGFLFIYGVGTGFIPFEMVVPMLVGSFILAFISVIVSSRSVRFAAPFALIYALSEGIVLGLITTLIDLIAPGVAVAALLATAAIFTVMLFLYSSRTIRVTPRFRRMMYSILLGILLFVVLGLVLPLFGVAIQFTDGIILLVSGVMIVVGAFMLTLDFDRAEMIVEGGMDKSYEWMVAVGLMVTLVWIYIELLRFLAILSRNRS
ncbi:MAG: Bax inhibitor-1/YccA family protein [Acholeplasmataceae bacterium]|nr:Bax inhibitor-1/YccA family protein [Acholeplasmataceae bacterium]